MKQDQENRKKLAKVIASAWVDPKYMERLRKEPDAVLKEAGVHSTGKVRIVEDSDDVTHLVLPKRPANLDEHRRKHKANPGTCEPNFCSVHPDFCSAGDVHPDFCSFP